MIARLLELPGRFFMGLANLFRPRPTEIQPQLSPRFDSTTSFPEELDDDVFGTPDPQAPRFLEEPDSFAIGEAGETILLDRRNQPPALFIEGGRTVVRANCKIEAFFGLVAYDQRGMSRGQVRFSILQPEITLTSNGSLAVRIKVTSVGDFPGALTITVTRNAPGAANPAPINFSATNMAGVDAETNRRPEIPIPPPPNLGPNNPVVIETIVAGVSWDPDNADPCSISPPEKLRVTWNFAPQGAAFLFTGPIRAKAVNRGSGVSVGETVVEETFPDGRKQFTVAVQTYFVVTDPNVCCRAAGEYAVIQFVRHRWQINEANRKKGEDTWTLDILDTEGQRARAGQTYDPTFTHNPRGSNPGADPLVYPGPGPSLNDNSIGINQFDRPGISRALYNRLAAAGGQFVFQFLSLLVCKLTPSEAANYLASGQIDKKISYEIILNFPGNNEAPTVGGRAFNAETYTPCMSLSDFISVYDRRNGRGPTGRLADGYRNPRNHEVGIPR